jgi:hypothetical protein
LAKEFTRQGHEVTVLFPTNGRDYAEYERINNVKIKDLGALGFKTIKLDGSGPLLLFKRALRRTVEILIWAVQRIVLKSYSISNILRNGL